MDKVFLQVVPDKGFTIEDMNGQQYTLKRAQELSRKGVVIEAPTFTRLREAEFNMEKVKEYYR